MSIIHPQYRYQPRRKPITVKLSTVATVAWVTLILAGLIHAGNSYIQENKKFDVKGDQEKLTAMMDADNMGFTGPLLPPPVFKGK